MAENSKKIYMIYWSSDVLKNIVQDYQNDPYKSECVYQEFLFLIKKEIQSKYDVIVKIKNKERNLADEIADLERGIEVSQEIDDHIFDIKVDFIKQAIKNCEEKNWERDKIFKFHSNKK